LLKSGQAVLRQYISGLSRLRGGVLRTSRGRTRSGRTEMAEIKRQGHLRPCLFITVHDLNLFLKPSANANQSQQAEAKKEQGGRFGDQCGLSDKDVVSAFHGILKNS